MFLRKRIAATLTAAGALLCTAQHAIADESGSFTSILVMTSSVATLQQSGETIFAGPSQGAGVITESSGDPFAVDGLIEMKCLLYGRISASGVSLEAPCTARRIDERRTVPAFEEDRRDGPHRNAGRHGNVRGHRRQLRLRSGQRLPQGQRHHRKMHLVAVRPDCFRP